MEILISEIDYKRVLAFRPASRLPGQFTHNVTVT